MIATLPRDSELKQLKLRIGNNDVMIMLKNIYFP